MLEAPSPTGTVLRVPETPTEDAAYFTTEEPDEARAYYDEYGYVVLRKVVLPSLCSRALEAFDRVGRFSRIPMLRQKNMRYERHTFSADGYLDNPIFNVQDLGSRALGPFRNAALDILTAPRVAEAVAVLLGCSRAKLIQSMFFEAPAGTWAHQDSYYQDSAAGLGGGIAGWYALEDIDAGAGRFYVCPGSHRTVPVIRNTGTHNFATGHDNYRDAMLETIRRHQVGFTAPYLAAGDVLFWNSLTIHGSLPASRKGVSRRSFTAHYLRDDDAMLQFHSRIRSQRMTSYNGLQVGMLHDQDLMRNRLVRGAAFHFPAQYMALRRAALRAVLAQRAARRALQGIAGAGQDWADASKSGPKPPLNPSLE